MSQNKGNKVVFLNCFGMEVIPDRYFNNLYEADKFALKYDLTVSRRLTNVDIEYRTICEEVDLITGRM